MNEVLADNAAATAEGLNRHKYETPIIVLDQEKILIRIIQ